MAGATGAPVARSHTIVVSRWLVMPMAAMRSSTEPVAPEPRGGPREGVQRRVALRRPDLAGVLFHPPRLREVLRQLALRRGDDAPLGVHEHRP